MAAAQGDRAPRAGQGNWGLPLRVSVRLSGGLVNGLQGLAEASPGGQSSMDSELRGSKWMTGLSENRGTYLAGLFGELDAIL